MHRVSTATIVKEYIYLKLSFQWSEYKLFLFQCKSEVRVMGIGKENLRTVLSNNQFS